MANNTKTAIQNAIAQRDTALFKSSHLASAAEYARKYHPTMVSNLDQDYQRAITNYRHWCGIIDNLLRSEN